MKRVLMPGEGRGHGLLFLAAAVIVAVVAGWFVYEHVWSDSSAGSKTVEEGAVLYHCPMHPTYTSDKPGECPICGMDLVPMERVEREGEGAAVEPSGRAPITVTDTQRQMIGVKTAPAEMRDLSKEIRTVGSVA